ncbi:MAG: AAA family ATPase [Actinomycetota bacterium]
MGAHNVPVVVVTGTIGAGKTTIAEQASEIMHARGIRHGLLEADWLQGVYPAPEDDPFNTRFVMKNITQFWRNYLDEGITKAIVTMTLETIEERDALLAALGHPPVTIARLEASLKVCEKRIRAREFGYLREPFLKKTGWLAEEMRRLDIGDIVLTNEEEPRRVATRLLEELGWI